MIDQEQGIRTRACTECRLCGTIGESLHTELKDHLFGAPGLWNLRRCPNPECGLLWLDPMPLQDDIGKAYQAYYTHGDIRSPRSLLKRAFLAARDGYLQAKLGYSEGVGPRWYRILSPLAYLHPSGAAVFDGMAMFLSAPRPGARLLDVGCGSGLLLARMRDIGWDVEGVDFDPSAVKAASAKRLKVGLGELRDQNYADNSFDAVHMNHVIEHVFDLEGLLAEAHRIMKSGGTLVITTPNAGSLGHRLLGKHWRPLEPPRHVFVYSARSLKSVVESTGLRIARLGATPRFANDYWTASRMIRDKERGKPASGPNIAGRIGGLVFLLAERILLLSHRFAGEELLLIAKKPEH